MLRIRNCLIGCALGDSLGLPREGLHARRAEKLFGNELRQCLFAGVGAISDDTQQSAMVYLAIQRHPDAPNAAASEFGRMLKKWFLTIPPGIGLATVKSSLRLLSGISATKSGVNSAGNGAAMRATVIGCMFADDQAKRMDYVEAISRVTHRHPLAVQGAKIVADAAAAFSQGNQDEFWLTFEHNYPDWPRDEGEKGCPTGYVVYSVNTVLSVIREKPNDLFGAIDLAISKGGDTDTIAAMAGAIVGAGTDSIEDPNGLVRWLGWPSASQIDSQQSVKYAQIVQANMVVLPAVLCHGFRRLFPPY